MQLFPLAFIFEKRNAVSAGIGDARNLHNNNRTRILVIGKGIRKRSKFGLVRFDNPPMSIQPKNVWRSLKGAEHQGDPSILLQVSDGLHAAPVEIQVSNSSRPQNAKSVQPFRREVDMTTGIQRSRSDKKYMLRLNEVASNVVDF